MEHIHICIQMQLQTMVFYHYIYNMISVTKFMKSNINYTYIYIHTYTYTDAEKPCAQTSWGDGGTKTKIYCLGTVCQTCILVLPQTIKLSLTKGGNQAKPVKYSEKSCISYKCKADVQTYGHQPWYTTNSDTAFTDVSAVHVSTLSHTSFGMLGESFVPKDELRTSQVCVL
jgi:hypothetical protein